MNQRCLRERPTQSRILSSFNAFAKGLYGLSITLCSPISLFLKCMGYRVLDVKFESLGHLSIEPDLYLREQSLLGEKHKTILFPPYNSLVKEAAFSSSVSNPFLLTCWKSHFIVIDHLFLYLLLYPILKSPILRYSPYHYLAPKSSLEYRKGRDLISIYQYSEQANGGFKSFLDLKKSDREKGRIILQKLGLPDGAWFCCFSAREPGYYTAENLQKNGCRNSSVSNLELALQEITSRGGWCIRVGSAATAPLPQSIAKIPQIIDYSHSGLVSDFMDVFLAASCRFAIGPQSGITELPRIFGVPCLIPNTVPFGSLSPSSESIHLFKILKSKKENRFLTFSESLNSYLSSSTQDEDYAEFQIELLENSPEEIRDATIEMLNSLDLKKRYSPEEEMLQNQFRSLMHSYNPGFRSHARVGTKFLQKYQELNR